MNNQSKEAINWLEGRTFGVELLKALRKARSEVGQVAESGFNSFDNYKYSTLGDYLAAVEPALEKAGLVLVIDDVKARRRRVDYSRQPEQCKAEISGALYHAATGQFMPIAWRGEGWDKGDKSLYKAITGARKYLIASLFNLYTDDDPEKPGVPPDASDDAPPRDRTPPAEKKKPPAERQPPPAEVQINGCKFAQDLRNLLEAMHKARTPTEQNRDRWLQVLDHAEKHAQANDWGDDHVAADLMKAIQQECFALAQQK